MSILKKMKDEEKKDERVLLFTNKKDSALTYSSIQSQLLMWGFMTLNLPFHPTGNC